MNMIKTFVLGLVDIGGCCLQLTTIHAMIDVTIWKVFCVSWVNIS